MSNRFATTATLALSIYAIGFAQSRYPDLPDNHWVFEDLVRLKKGGLYDEFELMRKRPDYFHFGRDNWDFTSRKSVAAAVVLSCNKAQRLADERERRAKLPSLLPVGKSSRDAFKSIVATQSEGAYVEESCRGPIIALINEFRAEIQALGESPAELKSNTLNALYRLSHVQASEPASALVQFKDVPPNHWAGIQILELRKLGILQGYPTGGFDALVSGTSERAVATGQQTHR
jgi:hypothetical protein